MKKIKPIRILIVLMLILTACGQNYSSYIDNSSSSLETEKVITETEVKKITVSEIDLFNNSIDNSIIKISDLYDFTIKFYEQVINETVDTASLDFLNTDNILYKKSLILGLAEGSEVDFENLSINNADLKTALDAMSQIYIQLQIKLFGNSDLKTGIADLSNSIEFYQSFYETENIRLFNMSEFWKTETINTKGFLTYAEAAEMLVKIFNANLKPLNINKDIDFSQTVIDYSLMESYFDGNAYVYAYQLEDIAEKFVTECAEYKNISLELNNKKMQEIFKGLYSQIKEVPIPTETKRVDNSRDYFFYYSQNNSGEYSDMNCMPAVTSMAIKWVYSDFNRNPEKLRNEILLNGEGWYPSNVMETLDKYKVSYNRHLAALENIITDLDKGSVIITQFSLSNTNPYGHCMLIYGYEKIGDSVQLLIYDPQIYPYGLKIPTDIKVNKAFEISYSGVYAEQLINSFTNIYIEIIE